MRLILNDVFPFSMLLPHLLFDFVEATQDDVFMIQ